MKGIKYNIQHKFREEIINKYELPIKEIILFMNKEMMEKYEIEVNITRNHIYNFLKRKDKVNKVIRHKFIIEKC
tara:strand:- start:217 stop:438 length:222 start_codon:yes stop_codon:yes gene_type:complete